MEAAGRRNEDIINNWVDQWRDNRDAKKVFLFWKRDTAKIVGKKTKVAFAEKFYQRALLLRSMRLLKLFA